MSWLPDDIREASGGERVDKVAHDTIRIAHRALEKFPDLVKRHKYIAGGAAISSSLVVLAGVAIAHRLRKGESPEEALAGVTEAEIEAPVRIDRPRHGKGREAQAGEPADAGDAAAEAVEDLGAAVTVQVSEGGDRANGTHAAYAPPADAQLESRDETPAAAPGPEVETHQVRG